MKYLIVYQNSGEDEKSKTTIECKDENRLFTQIFLNRYYDDYLKDLQLDSEDSNEIIFEDVILPIANERGIPENKVTNKMIEEFCKNYTLRDENAILLIKNLADNSVVYDRMSKDPVDKAGVRYF